MTDEEKKVAQAKTQQEIKEAITALQESVTKYGTESPEQTTKCVDPPERSHGRNRPGARTCGDYRTGCGAPSKKCRVFPQFHPL